MTSKPPNQGPENSPLQQQQFPLLQATFSPTGSTFNDIYSMLLPPNAPPDRSHNKPAEPTSYVFPELPLWDSLKLPEKMDLIELTNKDLSPSLSYNNYYGNIEPSTSIDGQYNRFDGAQWSNNYGAIKSYPSCAQVNKSSYYGDGGKSSTYCSIPKGSSDRDLYKSCAYYNIQNKSIDCVQNFYGNYASGVYDGKYGTDMENACFVQMPVSYDCIAAEKPAESQKENFDNYLSTLEHQSEVSNEESDIIVEDSSSEMSEEHEPKVLYQATVCFMCNTRYTSVGLQFYVLNGENPLTMSSQIPVKRKIAEFVGEKLFSEENNNYLCNDCLGLVNTIDHLQLRLEGLVKDLMNKFKLNRARTKARAKYGRYKCKRCGGILCVESVLRKHARAHAHKYLCELCGKTATSIKRFQRHLKIHKKRARFIKAFGCACDKLFRTKHHLKEHENFCLGLLPFECKRCAKKFASSTRLKGHVKLKHDKKFIAICSICNVGFIRGSDYKSHIASHGTDKKFSCDKCDKSYKTLSNLNFHLKSHLKSLPYVCAICRKGFMRKEYHEAHVNNHKGIKNYACTVCEKKFVSQKNLDAHVKYHDGTVKTSTCDVCKKVVTSNFEEHLRTHGNCKEFECDVCDMKFNTRNTLRKHKKRKHAVMGIT